MEPILLELLRRLEAMFEAHPELNDAQVRTAMDYAVLRGFIQAEAKYVLPEQFGIPSGDGNRLLREALADFIKAASDLGLTTLTERVVAFRNEEVATKRLDRIADFFAPFTTWLAEVVQVPLVIAPDDLAAETAANLVCIHRDPGPPVAPSAEQVESFLRAAIAVRRDQLAKIGRGDLVCFCWHDESSPGYLCLGAVSSSHERLPFDRAVLELREPTEVAQSFASADQGKTGPRSMLPVWVVKLPGSAAEPNAAADGGRDSGPSDFSGSPRGRRC